MFGLFKKKEPEEVNPRAVLRQQIQMVCDNAKLEKETILNGFEETISLICFVNEDFPTDNQMVHSGEAIADYFFFESQRNKAQQWYDRQKLTGKKNKIICYKVPSEHMGSLYKDHVQLTREGKKSPFKATSAIIYQGKSFPVAFCLGFMWGRETQVYNNTYDSFFL
jgi:hypothetical protein